MTGSTVTRYSNYFERYNDEALDPFGGNYGDLMATFRVAENPTQELTNSTNKFLLLPKSNLTSTSCSRKMFRNSDHLCPPPSLSSCRAYGLTCD
jgi:hypothetical protein